MKLYVNTLFSTAQTGLNSRYNYILYISESIIDIAEVNHLLLKTSFWMVVTFPGGNPTLRGLLSWLGTICRSRNPRPGISGILPRMPVTF